MVFINYQTRLAKLRLNEEKTQQEIADFLHCQREVYRRYETGIREIPVWAAILLAEHYNVSLDYLLGISNNKRHFGE